MHLKSTNSPFSNEQIELLNTLLPTLTVEQKSWISGYLAATTQTGELPASSNDTTSAPALSTAESITATVLYGSQTGNGQQIAEDLSNKLETEGCEVKLASMGDYKPKDLKNESRLFVVISTHGEGDPPDTAIPFYEFMFSRKAPKLDGVKFSVISLGDTSYEFFCQTGKEFDRKFEELGGERISERVDCDVDFEDDATDWIETVLAKVKGAKAEAVPESAPQTTGTSSAKALNYSRSHPFQAEVLENINLNGRGSNKETRHLELSLEGSGFEFLPGDSIGIFPKNDEVLVNQLIEKMQWDSHQEVTINKKGDTLPLKEALTVHFEITVLTKPLLEKASALTGNEQLIELLKDDARDQLRDYLEGRDLLDFVQDFGPFNVSEAEFVTMLRKIPPRLYSIASSYNANEDEVHLTISAVRYEAHNRERSGVCSVQCAERTEAGDTLPIFVQKNSNFRLPEDPDTPIIMIGPGTGVAPYRSFLEEREELDVMGKTWLFFGDQHFSTDFLYQVDWQRWLELGILTKMDVAFSRDTAGKVYVQHRMLEKSEELHQWMTEGAVIYVCGDEKQMAHNVHNALKTILIQQGNYGDEEAESFLKTMQQENRYQRDVY